MMFEFEQHEITILDSDEGTCSFHLNTVDGNGKGLQEERRKIYIIKGKTDILYVGETSTSLKTRFQRGCAAFNYYHRNRKSRNGYRGYKWLDRNLNSERNLTVHCTIFNSSFDPEEKREEIEAIEGELVFLIRKEFNSWPKFQNEIHFRADKNGSAIAIKIFDDLKK